ncbi:MAG TPA: hypothetical protein VFG37_00240 [Planctomycetota bacterium]|jgi:hypothetical protein|nr:hypothetical protein [Planctomycetota bacterium]
MTRPKTTSRSDADTMLSEYDFSKGVRGQTHRRYAEGSNVVVLDPDNAKVFPNSVAVNEALRLYIRLTKSKTARPRRRKST